MLAAKLENLQFQYGKFLVFDGLTMQVPRGSFCALVGRNGSGKSTLIKMMAGLLHPKAGTLRVLDKETDIEAAELLAQIGYVSESLQFSSPHLLAEILPIYHSSFPDWDYALQSKLLRQFKFEGKASFLEMSRGQRMLFCFVLAACHKPALYLIDEITSVLDPYNRKVVLDHIRNDVKAGATAILATNIVGEIDGYADRIIFLEGKDRPISGTLTEFCANFVKFSSSASLDDAQRKALDASLVGSEGESLLFVSRKDRLPDIQKARFQILNSRVTPMEAFIYLSQDGDK
jgi:ABC-type multidrug transport system ATPase subunit